jgi:hypothetical protein
MHGEVTNAYKILVGKLERERPLGIDGGILTWMLGK